MLQIHHNRTSAKLKVIRAFLLVILYSSLLPTCLLKSKVVHGKRFVIHVPMKIRTHHHTHTVYTHVHDKQSNAGKASKQTIYKIMGYSTHHTGLAGGAAGAAMGGVKVMGHGHHHRHHGHQAHGVGYRHNRAGPSSVYADVNYDDFLNCDEALPQGIGVVVAI